ncbi:MAG: hypothetical protein ACD_60C00143G0017 [uncultured bacterium]|nr:MAG: hypothetical protein ACD_60C00143G0017 [uncultured bacterium]
MIQKDKTIENLLDLDGIRYVIDDQLGLWVKFEVKKVTATKERPHGIRYSLTLHDRFNKRMIGFDNAHAIQHRGKRKISPKITYDHWHRGNSDQGRPYHYLNAGKLLEDFWKEVSEIQRLSEENKK